MPQVLQHRLVATEDHGDAPRQQRIEDALARGTVPSRLQAEDGLQRHLVDRS